MTENKRAFIGKISAASSRLLDFLVKWAFRWLTRSFYSWIVAAWLLWPLLFICDAVWKILRGMLSGIEDIKDGFSGPGYTREQWRKLYYRYHLKPLKKVARGQYADPPT